jgi:hypothetical protein
MTHRVLVLIEVTCDGCGAQGSHVAETEKEAREEARSEGVILGDGAERDACPGCSGLGPEK